MPDGGYQIRDQNAVHYITFSVVEWVDVFSRADYRHILLDHIRHSQQHDGLSLHAWVLMTNHFHAVMSAKEGFALSDILRDIKKYSSVNIIKAIQTHEKESRRSWMLDIFAEAGGKNARNITNQFWIQDNHPKHCYSRDFTEQKINYIHLNPVRAEIVSRPEDYLYSSATDYAGQKGLLDIEFLW